MSGCATTGHVSGAGNWTPKLTRRRRVNKSWGTAAIRLHHSFSPDAFFYFFFFTTNSLWSGRPPDDYVNTFSALCTYTRAAVDHGSLLTSCLVLLACFLSECYIAASSSVLSAVYLLFSGRYGRCEVLFFNMFLSNRT